MTASAAAAATTRILFISVDQLQLCRLRKREGRHFTDPSWANHLQKMVDRATGPSGPVRRSPVPRGQHSRWPHEQRSHWTRKECPGGARAAALRPAAAMVGARAAAPKNPAPAPPPASMDPAIATAAIDF